MKKIIIAIDGYSACGKSSTAKALANHLEYIYVDSGAMYRAVTLYFHDHHISLTNPKQVERALAQIDVNFMLNNETKACDTFLNGVNVEGQIREMYISEKVSEVSAISAVRRKMVEEQRKMGRKKGIVMDGRDIGTVVFPDAELKIFMRADLDIRAERRQQELLDRSALINLENIKENLVRRDQIDTSRSDSPLKQADDAVVIDTTHLTFEEQLNEIIKLAVAEIAQ
ncbi:MAG: (d)CMP kinase [Bacteroidota bacterium]